MLLFECQCNTKCACRVCTDARRIFLLRCLVKGIYIYYTHGNTRCDGEWRERAHRSSSCGRKRWQRMREWENKTHSYRKLFLFFIWILFFSILFRVQNWKLPLKAAREVAAPVGISSYRTHTSIDPHKWLASPVRCTRPPEAHSTRMNIRMQKKKECICAVHGHILLRTYWTDDGIICMYIFVYMKRVHSDTDIHHAKQVIISLYSLLFFLVQKQRERKKKKKCIYKKDL